MLCLTLLSLADCIDPHLGPVPDVAFVVVAVAVVVFVIVVVGIAVSYARTLRFIALSIYFGFPFRTFTFSFFCRILNIRFYLFKFIGSSRKRMLLMFIFYIESTHLLLSY